MMRFGVAIGAVLGLVTVAAALDDVVVERQADMKEIAAAAKAISEMFKTPETYSSEQFKRSAMAIGDRADQRLVNHFKTIGPAAGSKATEQVLIEPDRFAALAKDLKTYANALALAADRHPDAMSEDMRMKTGEPMGGGPLGTRPQSEASLSSMSAEHAFHLMLQTCSACHARFRTQ